MTPTTLALALAAAVGLSIGSFLNVVIHRLPRGQSLVRPGSRCPGCGRSLRWYDNVPVVSFLVLAGRCRQCGARISWRYPAVEIVTALLFVAVVLLTPPGPLLAARLVLSAALVALFAIDLEHQILPNAITLPGIGIGFAFSLLGPPGWQSSLIGIVAGGAIPYGIAAAYLALRGQEGLGMGDVKMLAMLGAFLGWQAMLLTLVLASFTGAVVGVALMATRGRGLQYALPFGTFLAVGAVAAMLAGEPVIAWYLGFFEGL
ncbi:MAG: prepilin peptidase [Acidobacteriota bacterium]